MKKLSKILIEFAGEPAHWCEGCKELHRIAVHNPLHADRPNSPQWQWNSNVTEPTFNPSILIRTDGPDENGEGLPEVCHYFINNGFIQYLSDSTHELSGQIVPLSPIPEEYFYE